MGEVISGQVTRGQWVAVGSSNGRSWAVGGQDEIDGRPFIF